MGILKYNIDSIARLLYCTYFMPFLFFDFSVWTYRWSFGFFIPLMIAPMFLKAHFQLATIRTRALVRAHPKANYWIVEEKIFLKRQDGKHYLILEGMDTLPDGLKRISSGSSYE